MSTPLFKEHKRVVKTEGGGVFPNLETKCIMHIAQYTNTFITVYEVVENCINLQISSSVFFIFTYVPGQLGPFDDICIMKHKTDY